MAEALARAKQRRAEAVAAQEACMAADDARTLRNAERAKEHGLVEKTAGESGAAGRLRNKWVAFLQTSVGKQIDEAAAGRRGTSPERAMVRTVSLAGTHAAKKVSR
jgi:hypothetical protein